MGAVRNTINHILALKSLDADEVWINNTALDVARYQFVAGPKANETWFIEITANTPVINNDQQDCLRIDDENQTWWIANGFTFLGHLTGVFLDQRHPQMASLLLNRLPAPLKEILPGKTVCQQAPAKDAYGLTLSYGTDDVCFQTGIWMSKSQWRTFLSNKKFNRAPVKNNLASLPCEAPIHIGSLALSLIECSQLEPGDLVFFDEVFFSNAGEGTLKLARSTANVTLDDLGDHYQLTIQHWNTTMNAQDAYESDELIADDISLPVDEDDSSEPLPRALEAPITDVPLKLNVKLGSIQFTLEELQRMVEGKTYLIDSVCPGKVQLMAKGVEVARGQLVEVDGKLAVEIHRRWVQAQ